MTFLESIDKEKSKKKLLIVISALTLVALALLLVIIVVSIAPGGIKGFKNYTVTDKDMKTGTLLVVNANHKYNIPSDSDLGLTSLKTYRDEHRGSTGEIPYTIEGDINLNKVAAENAHNMIIAMLNDTGSYDAPVNSGFRSQSAQSAINGVIKPGYSDHHTGMLLTINFAPTLKSPQAEKDAQIQWLNQHAHEYGFVLRYPADKSDKTGIISDYTNAYRYVGIAHATYMKNNALCLEEYVEYLKKNTNNEEPLSITASGAEYQVYYVSCKAGDKIKVPKNDYTISGTNEGGVIITAKVSK